MKNFFVFFFAISIFSAVQGQPTSNIDVLHYSFEINLSDTSDIITGKATIEVKFTAASAQVSFDLMAEKNGQGMTVNSVVLNNKPLQFVQQSEKLLVTLPVNVKPGDTSSFIINYKGIPAD